MTVLLTKPVSLDKATRTIAVGDLRRGDVVVKGATTGIVTDRYRIGQTMVVTVVSTSVGVTRDRVEIDRFVDVRTQPAASIALARANVAYRRWSYRQNPATEHLADLMVDDRVRCCASH